MKAADKTLSKRYAGAYMALDGPRPFGPGTEAPDTGHKLKTQGDEPKGRGGDAFDKHADAAAKTRIEDLKKVRDAAGGHARLFLHPLVGHDEKKEVLSRLLHKELMTSRAAAFARLLLKENRFYLLDAVIEDCARLYDLRAGIVRAGLVSSHLLHDEDLRRVEKILSASTGKKVLVTQTVSESAVGGVEIKMGDLMIDATIKGRLERLKRRILE